jgi:hypothetical protein
MLGTFWQSFMELRPRLDLEVAFGEHRLRMSSKHVFEWGLLASEPSAARRCSGLRPNTIQKYCHLFFDVGTATGKKKSEKT